MKTIQYTSLFFAVAFLSAAGVFAQDQATEGPDSTNIYLGEAVGRSQIDMEELPKEVMDSLKSSRFGDMEMVAIYKVDVVPGNETATDSAMRSEDPMASQRPYSMRDNDMDLEQTYYQDTYDDVLEEGTERESIPQETTSDTDMRKDIDPTDEGQVTQKQKPTNVDTYYEIEVSGDSDGYVILFNEKGQLTHTLPQGM